MPPRYLKVLLGVSLYFKKNPCVIHGGLRFKKNQKIERNCSGSWYSITEQKIYTSRTVICHKRLWSLVFHAKTKFVKAYFSRKIVFSSKKTLFSRIHARIMQWKIAENKNLIKFDSFIPFQYGAIAARDRKSRCRCKKERNWNKKSRARLWR